MTRAVRLLVPGFAIAVAFLASPGAGLHLGVPSADWEESPWQKTVRFYAKATTATDGRFLSADENETSAPEHDAAADATSGTSATVATLSGAAAVAYEFALRTPLAQDYWLNLSQQVHGVVWYTNAPSQQTALTGSGVESGRVRVELFAGSDRVAGSQFTYTVESTFTGTAPWHVIAFEVRPEVARLEKGGSLTLKVTRPTGLADFTIGTGGDHASYIELRYFDLDPTAGILYLEDGRLVSSTTGSSLTETSGAAAPGFFEAARQVLDEHPASDKGPFFISPPEAPEPEQPAAAPYVAAAFLVPLALGRSRRATLLGAAVGMVALAGCFGGAKPQDADIHDSAPSTPPRFVDDPEQNGSVGSVEGTIRDDSPVHLPVDKVHVAILKTERFLVTGKDGQYRFSNLTPGVYRIHADRDGFNSLEQDFEVKAAKTTLLDLILPRPPRPSNQNPHPHGDWIDGETSRQVWSDSFSARPRSGDFVGTDGGNLGATWVCHAGGATRVPTSNQFATPSQYCVARIPVAPTALIQPGTKEVTVTLSWDDAGSAPKELGLAIETPGYRWHPDGKAGLSLGPLQDPFVPRGKGQSFHIPIFPSEADVGHQKVTAWRYYVYTPYYEPLHPDQGPVALVPEITATIEIHRGTIPFEPAHLDLWGNLTQKLLFDPDTSDHQCTTVVQPASFGLIPDTVVSFPNPECRWALPLIPAGTKEIRGSLTWDYPVAGTTWRLAFRSAEQASDTTGFVTSPAEVVSEAPGNFSFRIPVEPGMTDGFYAKFASWAFYPSDQGDDLTRLSGRSGAAWRLWAVMEKDPTFSD